ncbi:PspC domain-containing protein [Rubrobacter taiwanensis]|uniref:PspC domain-containing protein n=1 Tax=Rubrobacter taiwanensis TaxID=185139 RepID=A0A4R1BEW6_9ACTN|nr:PspC domain-containing protein [Rubrobacter taiwanensis]
MRRSREDRWIAGVCGGIAHRFGWNSNLVRLAVVAVALVVPGVSIWMVVLAYVLAILLIPESEAY